jgi:hypothetical protein
MSVLADFCRSLLAEIDLKQSFGESYESKRDSVVQNLIMRAARSQWPCSLEKTSSTRSVGARRLSVRRWAVIRARSIAFCSQAGAFSLMAFRPSTVWRLLGVVVGSIGYFSKAGWLPNEAAGWVQAIGAMVAIAVAIGIAHVPERRHRKEEASKTKVMKLAIVNIAIGAEGSITDLRDEVAEINSSQIVFPDASLMAAKAQMITLNSVDLTKFPNEEMLVPFMRIKAQMEFGLSVCKTLKLSNLSDVDRFLALNQLEAAANNVSSSFLLLRQAFSATER